MDGNALTCKLNNKTVMTVARNGGDLSTRLTGEAWVAHFPPLLTGSNRFFEVSWPAAPSCASA
jgi:hypothetical protein